MPTAKQFKIGDLVMIHQGSGLKLAKVTSEFGSARWIRKAAKFSSSSYGFKRERLATEDDLKEWNYQTK